MATTLTGSDSGRDSPDPDGTMPRIGISLLSLVAVTVSLFVLAGGLLTWRDYRAERARLVEDAVSLTGAAATNVDDFLSDRIATLRTVSASPPVRTGDPEAIRAYFVEVQRANPSFDSIAWLDPTGGVRVRLPADPLAPLNVGDREYFRSTIASGQPFVSDALFSRVDGRPLVALAVPVQDDRGNLTGVLAAAVTLQQLERALDEFGARPMSAVFVVDRSGQLAVGGPLGSVANVSSSPLVGRARVERSGAMTAADGLSGERNRLVAFRDVPTGSWLVFFDEPEDEVFGPARRTLWLTLGGLAAVAIAALAGASWTGRRLDRLAAGQQQALRESEALREVARLLNSNLQMDQTLRLIAEQAQALFHADFAAVTTLERGHGAPVWRAVVGGRSPVWADLASVPSGIGERVAHERRPVVIAGFDPTGPEAAHLPVHAAEWLRSSLTVPLLQDDEVVGTLTVAWRTDRRVRETGVRLAEALASAAAVALTNARLYQQSQEAVRARDEFLASASHELRTPLSHIKGFVSTLRQTDVQWSQEELADFLAEIERETDRLGRMIGDVLDISLIESGGLALAVRSPVQPRTLVELGADLVRADLSRHTLEVQVADDLPPVYVNAGQMERVIANLLENAAKYAPAGTTIRVQGARVDSEAELRIEDEGPGIPPEHRERVFERFVRLGAADSSGVPGTGLGLAISRGIVQAHGGRIWLEERSAGGAAFVVRLPLAWSVGGSP